MTKITAAKIENNIVTQVIVGDKDWAETYLGGTWIDTTTLPVGIGFTYHGDHFRPPQPFPSWVWENSQWNAPIPYPTDENYYRWDEENLSWIQQQPIETT